jgi:membrane fusion protein, multidrug efflux system
MPDIRASTKQRKRAAAVAVILIAVAGTGVWYWHWRAPPAQAQTTQPAIPVETALATRADVPIYFDGLGTVQAFNTVTVTTRVDGALQSVNFVEGQEVKTGDVLAQIDPRPYQAALDQAVATKAKDAAQLANAQLDLQRYVTLAPQNYTSKQTLDTQRALVAQLDAQVKMDQAAIDAAQTNLDYTTIRSPIDGRTGIRLVDAGNNLLTTANTALVVVTQLHPISVLFTLPEEDFSAVSQALSSVQPLTTVALSRDQKTELDRGKVAVLDNQISQTTGTLRLKATFPNPKETLWPGDFVNIELLIKTEQNVLTVPSTAVQRGPNGLFAYVVGPGSTVAIRPIAMTQFEDGKALITAGLQPGDRVVSAGQYRLQPGAKVESTTADIANTTATDEASAGPTP